MCIPASSYLPKQPGHAQPGGCDTMDADVGQHGSQHGSRRLRESTASRNGDQGMGMGNSRSHAVHRLPNRLWGGVMDSSFIQARFAPPMKSPWLDLALMNARGRCSRLMHPPTRSQMAEREGARLTDASPTSLERQRTAHARLQAGLTAQCTSF